MGNKLTVAKLEGRAVEVYRSLPPEAQGELDEYAHALIHDRAKADRMMQELRKRVEGTRGGATV